jgi:hypothetical protein
LQKQRGNEKRKMSVWWQIACATSVCFANHLIAQQKRRHKAAFFENVKRPISSF